MKNKKVLWGLKALVFLFLASCSKNEDFIAPSSKENDQTVSKSNITPGSGSGTFYGAPISFNSASIRSFVTISDFVPTAIGYELSNAVFNNLPNANAPEDTQLMLSVPGIPNTFVYDNLFKNFSFQWDPHGHDPQGVFSFPHFDFHMYTITEAERLSIDANSPAIMVAPDPVYIPNNYFGPIGPLSGYGSHWVDLLSPEFNGGSFTRTFVYGSNNGKVIFQEPMITLAFLTASNNINDVMPIRQPAQYQVDGYYPTTYRIVKDNNITKIFLADFVKRTGSVPVFDM